MPASTRRASSPGGSQPATTPRGLAIRIRRSTPSRRRSRPSAAITASTRPARRSARRASTCRSSSTALRKATCAARRRRSSTPTRSAACARAFARPRTCASATACAIPTRLSRSRSACCNASPPMPISPIQASRCSFARRPPGNASPSSAPVRQVWPPRTGWRCSGTTSCCSRRAPSWAGSTNTDWRATRRPTASRRRKSTGCFRSAASKCAPGKCSAVTSPSMDWSTPTTLSSSASVWPASMRWVLRSRNSLACATRSTSSPTSGKPAISPKCRSAAALSSSAAA